MDIAPAEIHYYQTTSKRRPFQEWLDGLDTGLRQIAAVRLARIRRGLFGDAEPVGEGRDGKVVVVLLHAGEKKRQSADIRRAQAYWKDYLRRTRR